MIGETISQTATSGGIAECYLSSWNSSGNRTDVYYTFNLVSNVWGDDGGQFVANQAGAVYVWNGTRYATTGNSNLSGTSPYGMSGGGLVFGENDASTQSWAYDLNTGKYYSFAPGTNSWANCAPTPPGTWSARTAGPATSGRSPTSRTARSAAWSRPTASPATANTSPVKPPAEMPPLSAFRARRSSTYWSGEATFVNDSGLVVGDTGIGRRRRYERVHRPRHGPFPGLRRTNGQPYDRLRPAGVTFNFAAGVNDAGQILVWSDGGLSDDADGPRPTS